MIKGQPENLTYGEVTVRNSPIRTITDEHNALWFCASDIAKMFGYINSGYMVRMLNDTDKHYFPLLTHGGWQKMTFITAYGFIYCLFRATGKDRKEWQNWFRQHLASEPLIFW